MPRAGLGTADVVRAAADLADEIGIDQVTLTAVAANLKVKAPALYKHVDGIADLRHRIATLAMIELGDNLRRALQGKSGVRAIDALFRSIHSYALQHPGRYNATTGARFRGAEDELRVAAADLIESIRAVMSSYRIAPADLDHAIRMVRCTLHGYALLQQADGFQWDNNPDDTMDWMIGFIDAGLSATGEEALGEVL